MSEQLIEVDRSSPLDVLRRFAKLGNPSDVSRDNRNNRNGQHIEERCDMCGDGIRPDHRHMLNLKSRQVLCTCQACVLLLDSPLAGGGARRLIPDRVRLLEGSEFNMSDMQWEALQIPVRMAYLCRRSDVGRAVAFYPSPMGPTEAALPRAAWEELCSENRVLDEMELDVEALLIDRRERRVGVFLAPLDVCYQLTGLVRMYWKGMSGGSLVQMEVDRFFVELCERAASMGADNARS